MWFRDNSIEFITIFMDGSCYASDKSISDELDLHNDKNKSHREFDISISWWKNTRIKNFFKSLILIY